MEKQNENTEGYKLHSRLLEMMTVFHEFCATNNIDYYMLGGTALGAYRHKGFIPWDDDIDIGIPRLQYEQMLRIADKLPEGLELKTFHNTKNFPYNFAKLVDKNTTLIEEYYPKNVMGVFIDIFPLDGTNKNQYLEKFKQYRIRFWNCTLRNHYHTKPKDNVIKKVYKMFSVVMPPAVIHSRLDYLLQKDSLEGSTMIANYLGAWWIKEVMRKDIFSEPTPYDFEGQDFYGPENITDYLEQLYSDYMKLPPEEERMFKHGFSYLSFDKPYAEFKKRGD